MPLKRSNGDTLDRKSKGGFGRRKSRGSNDDLERAAAAAAFVTTLEPNKSFRSRGFADGNSGLKRKRNRIYADNGTVDAESSMKQYGMKSLSKAPQNVVGWNLDKGNKLLRGKAHKFEEDPGKSKLLPGSFDNKGKMESAHQLKNVQDKPFADTTTTTSKIYKRKPSFDSNRKYATTDSRRNSRGHGKKSLATDSDPPKKNKRVIRLDPHDTSNKRLNDDVPTNGNGPEKKDLAENTHVEMSKNAQFRAIRPSPSILSFVEDNFLGRRREIEFRRAGYNIELSAPLDNIPLSTSSERERIEVPVFRNKLEFFAAAKISSSFPPPDLPEIAFAGRSNVGKSSLLNSLTRQWGVVRTSDKPGLTQTINFFKLGPKLSLVDLPGYGFAYAKEEVKESWEELVKEYVTSRVGLKRVCLLVDTQWGMKPRDHELIDLMERSQTKYQIVLTKTDLVFPIDVARRAMQIEENLKAKKSAVQPLMMVSSKTGAGIRSLRTVLANIARFARR